MTRSIQVKKKNILVIGVGNTLLQDDGIGIHVTSALRDSGTADLNIIDGGTIGLSLLPQVEDSDALIIVDAAELKEHPGYVRVYFDDEVDRFLSAGKRTVHEVGIIDLLSAAGLRGCRPGHCALVAIQPDSTEWGVEPTPDVQSAIPAACEAIQSISRRWRNEP